MYGFAVKPHYDNGDGVAKFDIDNDESGTDAVVTIHGSDDPEMAAYSIQFDWWRGLQFITIWLGDEMLWNGKPEVHVSPIQGLAAALRAVVEEPEFNAVARGTILRVVDEHVAKHII